MPAPTSTLATLRPDLAGSFMQFDLALDRQGFIGYQVAPIIDVQKQADPPLGNSGIRLQVEVRHMLEGFRKGAIVRFGTTSFPAGIVPPEERVNGVQDRTRTLFDLLPQPNE